MTNVLDAILAKVNQALPIAESIVAVLVPEAAAAAAIGVKIAQGVIAGIPEAESLWAQFQSGNIPTQDELDAYAANELAAYQKLMADIQAKLAAMPKA